MQSDDLIEHWACTIRGLPCATVLWMTADCLTLDPHNEQASQNSSYAPAPVRVLYQMQHVHLSKHEAEYLYVYMPGQSVTTQLCKSQICRCPVQQIVLHLTVTSKVAYTQHTTQSAYKTIS